MIEPIKLGDDLFPFDVEIIDGIEVETEKRGWTDEKEVALNIRTIDYWLQFENEHGSVGLINMIEFYSIKAMEIGTDVQKKRFRELMMLREEWLRARTAA